MQLPTTLLFQSWRELGHYVTYISGTRETYIIRQSVSDKSKNWQRMTRINLVRVEDLADQHLFAEWREIKMIVPAAKRSLHAQPVAKIYEKICPQYTLNTGHVTFFYNKLAFLKARFDLLTVECYQRGFDITPFEFRTDDYYFVYGSIGQKDWQPTKRDVQVNVERVSQRLNEKPNWYRYYGDVYSPDFFIDRYNQQLLFDTIAVV